ncbi:hypothetical protein CK203_001009 [Vitis vinifera]|uniref:Uncharacterized protein n=1 Tax=Vitis vinifera TaxID=29760 RepID=A0A438KLP4_VITVI|nr:hypothetical protein CK203_001009 [Vitis vinifera]
MGTDGSIALNSMHSDTLDAAILDLEELANKVKWVKGILDHGIPLPMLCGLHGGFWNTMHLPHLNEFFKEVNRNHVVEHVVRAIIKFVQSFGKKTALGLTAGTKAGFCRGHCGIMDEDLGIIGPEVDAFSMSCHFRCSGNASVRLGRLFNPRLALLDCCSLCSSKTLFRFEKYGLMGWGRFLGESFGGISSRVGGVSLYEFGGDMLEPEVKVLWFQEGDWKLGISSAVLTATEVKCVYSASIYDFSVVIPKVSQSSSLNLAWCKNAEKTGGRIWSMAPMRVLVLMEDEPPHQVVERLFPETFFDWATIPWGFDLP